MLAEVKKCVEHHDIMGLRYIFVDCLDVDPTFEKYKEDYEYCKSIDGMFDAYQELNGMTNDEDEWSLRYWDQLKLDLMKNFSEKRFEHMIKVAKVIYADKITRLLAERNSVDQIPEKVPGKKAMEAASVAAPAISEAEQQERRLAERRRELEAENQRIEAEQRAQRARIEAAKREGMNQQNSQRGVGNSKKAWGIVLAIIAVVVVVFIVMALQ